MADTTLLALPLIAASQGQKHVTHNEAIRLLDGIVQLSVINQTLTAPPGSPAAGDRYIVATGATGLWTGFDDCIAYWVSSAWVKLTPQVGWQAYDAAQGSVFVWTGTVWANMGAAAPSPDTFALSDETSNLTTGLKLTHRIVGARTLSAVRINCNTAPTGATIIVDVKKNGTTIFSTKVSIDATEKTSVTAASAAVLSTTAFADDDEVTWHIDQIGSTVAGKGLKGALIWA
jgi:hypothetical protein